MSLEASALLTEGLDRLERERRWWKCGGLAACLILAAIVLMGQGRWAPRVIDADAFVLRDSVGKIRAMLGPANTGVPVGTDIRVLSGQYGLHFYGTDGAYRAGLREWGDEGESWAFDLRGKDTITSASLWVVDGAVSLNLLATEQHQEALKRAMEEWNKRSSAAKTPEERAKIGPIPLNIDHAALLVNPKDRSSFSLRHGGMRGVRGLEFSLLEQEMSLALVDRKRKSIWKAP